MFFFSVRFDHQIWCDILRSSCFNFNGILPVVLCCVQRKMHSKNRRLLGVCFDIVIVDCHSHAKSNIKYLFDTILTIRRSIFLMTFTDWSLDNDIPTVFMLWNHYFSIISALIPTILCFITVDAESVTKPL